MPAVSDLILNNILLYYVTIVWKERWKLTHQGTLKLNVSAWHIEAYKKYLIPSTALDDMVVKSSSTWTWSCVLTTVSILKRIWLTCHSRPKHIFIITANKVITIKCHVSNSWIISEEYQTTKKKRERIKKK